MAEAAPSLSDLTRAFARIGLLSFGGPAAQISMMHRDIVDDRKWISEKDYLSALSFCMLLPGPEAMQLATWIGWRSHGTWGGLITGGLFVLPGALVVLALSALYAGLGHLPFVLALFAGVQAAVIAVVVEALVRVAKRALKTQTARLVAFASFAALFLFNLPFPVIILAAALLGVALSRGETAAPVDLGPLPVAASLRAVLIWGALWLVPLGLLIREGGLLGEIALFFSKLAVLTFGGAYAVLSWMAQEVVEAKGWLTLTQMMDGLGLAETTPGPLILVTQFVGFMTGFGAGGWGMALAGAVVTLWMTFLPCFLWIFAGAPWIARLTSMPRLKGALDMIMAAVVGVITHLALWFAVHVLFATQVDVSTGPFDLTLPDPQSLKPLTAVLALAAGYALLIRHWPLIPVLAAAALASALAGVAGIG